MFQKNRKKSRLYVMVVTCCLVLASVTVVLTTPETALTAPPEENPGGNVVKRDIPGELTLDNNVGDGLTGVGGSYSDLEAGTTCFIGRRRGIWVSLSKSSPRTMNLTLGALVANSFEIPNGSIIPGDDPWGDPVMNLGDVMDLTLPNGAISQVDLGIAPAQNVSGLGGGTSLSASTKLIFLDSAGDQWGLFFGAGRTTEDGWGGLVF